MKGAEEDLEMKHLFGLLLASMPMFVGAYVDVGDWRVSSYDLETRTAILGRYRGSSTAVTVPNEIIINVYDSSDNKYKDVHFDTILGDNLFRENTTVVSVSLGNHASVPSFCFYKCSSLNSVSSDVALSSVGGYAFRWCGSLVSIPSLESVILIEDSAFDGCSSLNTRMSLKSVITIKYRAFRNCSSLTGILELPCATTIEDEAFIGCLSLSSVMIDNVSSMGNCVFEGCSAIEDAKIAGNTDIKGGVFRNCLNLRNVEFTGNTRFGDFKVVSGIWGTGTRDISPFEGCTSLEKVVLGCLFDTIQYSTFKDLSSLKEVMVDCGFKNIEGYAFSGCSALVSVPSLESVTNIGASAFSGCSSLSGVVELPNAENVGKSAFSGCLGMIRVNFSGNLTSIGSEAFYGCTSLKSIRTAPSLKALGESAFRNCAALEQVEINGINLDLSPSKFIFNGCTSLRDVSFGDGVTVLPIGSSSYNGPFVGCTALEEVTVGTGVTEIPVDFLNANRSTESPRPGKVIFSGNITRVGARSLSVSTLTNLAINLADGCIVDYEAFLGCPGVNSESIDFTKIASIGSSAFSGCTSLKSIRTAPSLKALGESAFRNCAALEQVEINGINLDLSPSKFIFNGCTSLRDVSFGDGVTVLPIGSSSYNGPFVGCTALEEVTVGTGVTEIPVDFLNANRSTESPRPGKVIFSGNITRVGARSLSVSTLTNLAINLADGCIVDYEAFLGCPGVNSESIDFTKIASIGSSAFSGCSRLFGSLELPKAENIGGAAFNGCTSLTSVVAHNISSLGHSVFYDCSGLESVSLSGNAVIEHSMFRWCKSLREVKLLGGISFPLNGYSRDYQWPFNDTGSLEEVVLGEGVSSIPGPVFGGQPLLRDVRVTSSLTEIHVGAFSGCTSLPRIDGLQSVKFVGEQAFLNCTSLESFEGFSTVTNIGTSAFSGCSRLFGSLELPKAENIGGAAFNGCTSLTSVVAHNISSLGHSVFYDCSGLESVSLSGNAVIEHSMFRWCKSLREVKLLGGISFPLNGYSRDYQWPFNDTGSLEEVVLGEGVSSIPGPVFGGQPLLRDVRVTSSLTEIHVGAFSGCTSLPRIDGLQSVKFVGEQAFLNCTSLESFEGFSTVTNIGTSAFSGCSSLTGKVDLAVLQTVEGNTFKGCERLRQVKFGKDLELVRADAFNGSTNLIAFSFEGQPPEADDNAFRNVKKGALGIYPGSTLQLDDSENLLRSAQSLSETSDVKEWCDVIAEDGTWKKLLMCPNKPILTNDVYYVDEGSLRLNWETNMPPKEYGLTYEIRRGFSDNYDTADILTNGYKELTYIDKQFDFTGGVSRIWYWVKPEHPELKDDELRHSDACRTKNRYCLTAGTVDLGAFNDSKLFVELAGKKGGFLSYKPLKDPSSNEIDKAIDDVLPILKAGDIYVIYMAAHGIESGDDSYLSFKGSEYYASQLKVVSEAVAERKVRFVGIIMSCHSQAMIKDGQIVKEKERLELFCNGSCGEGSNDLIAWITSSRKEQFSYTADITTYTRFGNSLLRYGWGEGYADLDLFIEGKQEKIEGHNDDRITLLEMAHYAAVMAVGGFADFFRWAAMSSIDGNSSVYIQNPELLSRIDMGKVSGTHVSGNINPPSLVLLVDSIVATPTITWTPVSGAECYRVYRYLNDSDRPQAIHLQVKGISVKDKTYRGFLNRRSYKYFVQSENPAGISKRSMIAVEEFWKDSGIDINDFKDSLSEYGMDMSKVDEEEVDRIASSDLDGDGISVADEFIAGVSPIDATSQFTANITMENGMPKVTPVPDLGEARKYTIYGKTDLGNPSANWTDMSSVLEEEKPEYRFFKVGVSLP